MSICVERWMVRSLHVHTNTHSQIFTWNAFSDEESPDSWQMQAFYLPHVQRRDFPPLLLLNVLLSVCVCVCVCACGVRGRFVWHDCSSNFSSAGMPNRDEHIQCQSVLKPSTHLKLEDGQKYQREHWCKHHQHHWRSHQSQQQNH